MTEPVLFRDLKLQGIPLYDCEVVYKDDYDNLRLYVLKDIEANNFWAMLVDFFQGGIGDDDTVWSHSETLVEKVFAVTAYWDGVRHLDGYYMNYPDVKKLSEVFSVLAEIEDMICTDSCRKKFTYSNET